MEESIHHRRPHLNVGRLVECGGGVHSSSTTQWKDLAGSLDLTLTDNAVINSNNIATKYAYRKGLAYSKPFAVYLGDVQTIEIVCSNWKNDNNGTDYFSLGTLNTA